MEAANRRLAASYDRFAPITFICSPRVDAAGAGSGGLECMHIESTCNVTCSAGCSIRGELDASMTAAPDPIC